MNWTNFAGSGNWPASSSFTTFLRDRDPAAKNDCRGHREALHPEEGGSDLPTPVATAFDQMRDAVQQTGSFPPEMRLQPLRNALTFIQSLLSKEEVWKNNEQYRAIDAIATHLALQAWFIIRNAGPTICISAAPFAPTNCWISWFGKTGRSAGHRLDAGRRLPRGQPGLGQRLSSGQRQARRRWAGRVLRLQFQDSQEPDAARSARRLDRRVPGSNGQASLARLDLGVRSYREAADGIHLSPAVATPDEFSSISWNSARRFREHVAD